MMVVLRTGAARPRPLTSTVTVVKSAVADGPVRTTVVWRVRPAHAPVAKVSFVLW